MLAPQTEVTLKELRNAPWFTAVGQPDVQHAKILQSWREALTFCADRKWEDMCLDAANQLTVQLFQQHRERYKEWGKIAQDVRAVVDELLAEKVRPFIQMHHLPETLVNHVGWDISHLLMESEYADVIPPSFFAGLGFYYVKGHFPCSWEGEYPKGRLIVY